MCTFLARSTWFMNKFYVDLFMNYVCVLCTSAFDPNLFFFLFVHTAKNFCWQFSLSHNWIFARKKIAMMRWSENAHIYWGLLCVVFDVPLGFFLWARVWVFFMKRIKINMLSVCIVGNQRRLPKYRKKIINYTHENNIQTHSRNHISFCVKELFNYWKIGKRRMNRKKNIEQENLYPVIKMEKIDQ